MSADNLSSNQQQITIAHAPTCPVASPHFEYKPGVIQCNCDIMDRLAKEFFPEKEEHNVQNT